MERVLREYGGDALGLCVDPTGLSLNVIYVLQHRHYITRFYHIRNILFLASLIFSGLCCPICSILANKI